MLESVLLLCAEMDDGLGLLVTSRPHGLTAAQLCSRVDSEALFNSAASEGTVRKFCTHKKK